MNTFSARKDRILRQLEVPDEEYQDASPKGSVDENIRELVSEINSMDNFVTTSSCGGRVAVYLEGPSKTSSGGKGGGKWLFTSHQPIDMATISSERSIFSTLHLPDPDSNHALAVQNVAETSDARASDTRFVHFKFEPMILHILTASLPAAQQALSAAMDAGFRESGVGSILSKDPNKSAMPMLAVRTTGLSFDCIVACCTSSPPANDGSSNTLENGIRMMVSEEYLRTIVCIANERFQTNELRKERFRRALLNRVVPPPKVLVNDLPESVMKEKLDAERRSLEEIERSLRYDVRGFQERT